MWTCTLVQHHSVLIVSDRAVTNLGHSSTCCHRGRSWVSPSMDLDMEIVASVALLL